MGRQGRCDCPRAQPSEQRGRGEQVWEGKARSVTTPRKLGKEQAS